MVILGIDTSSSTGGVAIMNSASLVGECLVDVRRTHSEKLVSALDSLMRLSEIRYGDLSAVAVSRGPGSYTGLRIGIVTAKTLCYALEIPLVGVSTLEALALNLAGADATVVSMIDARRDQIYYSIRSEPVTEAGPRHVASDAFGSVSDLVSRLAEIEGKLILVGPGAVVHGGAICKQLGSRCSVAPATHVLCRPSSVAAIGLQRLERGDYDSVEEFEPTYLRPSEAELRLSERYSH